MQMPDENHPDKMIWLEHLNRIAALPDLRAQAKSLLAWLCAETQAAGGIFWVGLPDSRQVKAYAAQGVWEDLAERTCLLDASDLQALGQFSEVQILDDLSTPFLSLHVVPDEAYQAATHRVIFRFAVGEQAFGWGLLAFPQRLWPGLLEMVVHRLSPDLKKQIALNAERQTNARMRALVAIIGELTSTLDKDALLKDLLNRATELLDAEASSLFLVDDTRNDLALYLASNQEQLPVVRVPLGKGVIGETVSTGKVLIINDVAEYQQHFRQVDESSGFSTRSIVAVPLISRALTVGGEIRQERPARIIGGLEALNKRQGQFTEEDATLLSLLANQAATILSVASLYADANELFWDAIQALVAFIDAKDPHTEDHSHRVSEFAVAIAREMGLSPDKVYLARLGGLLHDIGKIAVADSVLLKGGKLTPDELAQIRKHPVIGEQVVSQVRLLKDVVPAIGQHHERLDGKGYPRGLKGEQIHLLGRIMAVADVFDALTSDRPYRQALAAEEALDFLHQDIGLGYDPRCVHALTDLYLRGEIQTAHELKLLSRAETGNGQPAGKPPSRKDNP